MLLYRRSEGCASAFYVHSSTSRPGQGRRLTARYDDPNEVHEKVITPEIVCLRSAVRDSFIVVVEHAGRVIKDIAIDLAEGYQCLERVP